MQKVIVVAGMAGVGKTFLSQKYSNVIDLDHLYYKYSYAKEVMEEKSFEELKGFSEGRTNNPDWPQNYFAKFYEYIKDYDIVLLPSAREIIDYLDEVNFEYFLCYPDVKSKDTYMKRYKNRGANETWMKKMDENFEDDVNYFESKKAKKVVLSGDETLEDKLKEMGVL